MKLAITLHPYYKESWLSKPQAQAFMQEHGFGGIRVTAAWCQANSIEVASTGHIRLLSLQFAIDRMRSEVEQREQDLRGA